MAVAIDKLRERCPYLPLFDTMSIFDPQNLLSHDLDYGDNDLHLLHHFDLPKLSILPPVNSEDVNIELMLLI